MTLGNPDPNFALYDISPRYTVMLSRLGFKEVFPIRGIGLGPDSDVRQNNALMQLVKETAGKIAAG